MVALIGAVVCEKEMNADEHGSLLVFSLEVMNLSQFLILSKIVVEKLLRLKLRVDLLYCFLFVNGLSSLLWMMFKKVALLMILQ